MEHTDSEERIVKSLANGISTVWADNPEGCNLYNREGLPASPFRTDLWPGVTAPKE